MPRNPESTPRWGSLDVAADYMGVHVRTIRRMISDGSITGYRLGKRTIRVDLAELDALLTPIPAAG